MVLTDDNFVSIAHAVEEGRGIYDNIKKFLRFQLSTNIGAILLIFIGLLIGLPLPLAPLQILFINLLMDGPPALSLSMRPSRPPLPATRWCATRSSPWRTPGPGWCAQRRRPRCTSSARRC